MKDFLVEAHDASILANMPITERKHLAFPSVDLSDPAS